MQNDFSFKEVDFLGTKLIVVRQNETGKLYTPIDFILSGLGFDKELLEYQRDKWINDKVISKGIIKISRSQKYCQNRKGYHISLSKLPLALEKIDIIPKMQKEIPELLEKLEIYQDNCVDVLLNTFFKDSHINNFNCLESIETINEAANIIMPVLEDNDVSSIYKALVLKQLYEKAGIEIQLIRYIQGVKSYDKKGIAKALGIYTPDNEPHVLFIDFIMQNIHIDDDDIIKVNGIIDGETGTSFKYKPNVLGQIYNWLKDKDYPQIVINGKVRYDVIYKNKGEM